MRSKSVKIITMILVLATLFLLFAGCSNVDVSFDRDGTGTATISISKEEGMTIENVEQKVEEMFAGVKMMSQNRDVLKLKSIKENNDGFQVKLSFRRIKYIDGVGQYNFMSHNDFLKELNKKSLISNWEKGKYKTIQNYDETIYNFNNQADAGRAFSPITYDGKSLKAEDLISEDSEYTNDKKGMIFTYFIVGLENVQSITYSFKGEIKIVGGKDVEIVDKNTVKVKPLKTDVMVTEQNEGDIQIENRTVDCFAGYVYFIESADYTLMICLIVAGVVLTGLIVVGIWRGWFKKIWKGQRCTLIRKNYSLYLMMIPAIVLLALFSYGPMTGIVLAFKDFNIDDGIWGSEWTGMFGFKHFHDVLTAPGTQFGMLVRNTIILAILKFIFGFLCAIVLAVLFNYLKNGLFKKTVQTISYLPYFLSWVVVSGIAYLFLAADGGTLNQIVEAFGGKPIQWYSEPKYWRAILTFTSVWKTVGYGTIVYLAAMTAIDPALYEAALIDGAGRVKQLVHVTLPGMFPVIGIQLIFSVGNLVKDDFDQIYTMTGQGNSSLIETTEVIGTLTFKAIGTVSAYASAAAMGLMQSVVSLALVLASNLIVKRMGIQGMF